MTDWSTGSKLAVLAIIGILTVSDLFFKNGSESSVEVRAQKNIPEPKISKFMGPTIKFLYWKVFEQYAGILQQKYPDLAIEGSNFPPTPWKFQLAQILGVLKIGLIICVVFSINPFEFFGAATPSAFRWLNENKLYGCLMIFFLSNALETHLISTGAFEISVDNIPVWSKIKSGRIPQPPELFQIIENYFKMSKRVDGGREDGFDAFKDEL